MYAALLAIKFVESTTFSPHPEEWGSVPLTYKRLASLLSQDYATTILNAALASLSCAPQFCVTAASFQVQCDRSSILDMSSYY